MANNLVISYDLYKTGQDYTAITTAIKNLGIATKIHFSVWYVKSSVNYQEAATRLWKVMDSNDSLFVADVTTNNAYWYNISETATKIMQDNWNK